MYSAHASGLAAGGRPSGPWRSPVCASLLLLWTAPSQRPFRCCTRRLGSMIPAGSLVLEGGQRAGATSLYGGPVRQRTWGLGPCSTRGASPPRGVTGPLPFSSARGVPPQGGACGLCPRPPGVFPAWARGSSGAWSATHRGGLVSAGAWCGSSPALGLVPPRARPTGTRPPWGWCVSAPSQTALSTIARAAGAPAAASPGPQPRAKRHGSKKPSATPGEQLEAVQREWRAAEGALREEEGRGCAGGAAQGGAGEAVRGRGC